MAYGTAALTGTYKTFDDQPAEGVVEIIPNSRSLVDGEGDVILAGRVKVALDAAGSFSVTLPATDDTTVEPATGRQYTVVAKLRHTHLPAVTGVELTTGATVDVSDVAPQPIAEAQVTPAATVAQLAALQAEVDAHEANTANPHATTAAQVGADPAGSAAAAEAAAKAASTPIAHATDTANPHAVTKAQVGLGNVDNVSAASLRDRSTHTGTQPVASITGLAPVATSGNKADVGLGNVDNTSDAAKPISTAAQAALDDKQNAAALSVNALNYGATGDGTTDDTAAIQAAIDAASSAGGGRVYLPAGNYVASQLVVKRYVHLHGDARTSFGGTGTATRITQKPGTALDLIVFEAGTTAEYAGPASVTDLVLRGDAAAAAGCGVALRTTAGTTLRMQDTMNIERLQIRGFAQDGLWVGGGSPAFVSDIACLFNGGYGVRVVNSGTNEDVQFCSFTNISGDGNSGGALLRFEGVKSHYAHRLAGIKSEQRANSDRGGAIAQANAIQFHNCAHTVVIDGLQHISSSANTTKPGDAIVLTGDRPTVVWSAVGVRTLATQTTGATPVLLRDSVGTAITIPTGVSHGVYGGTIDTRSTSQSSASRYLFGAEDGHTKPAVLAPEMGLSGLAPGYTLIETDAATDAKQWALMANGGVFEIRMVGDDGSTGSRPLLIGRTGKASPTIGFLGAAPVARPSNPGTATGTDAAVINNIVTALRNLGLVS